MPNSAGSLVKEFSESEVAWFPVLCRIDALVVSSIMVVEHDWKEVGEHKKSVVVRRLESEQTCYCT